MNKKNIYLTAVSNNEAKCPLVNILKTLMIEFNTEHLGYGGVGDTGRFLNLSQLHWDMHRRFRRVNTDKDDNETDRFDFPGCEMLYWCTKDSPITIGYMSLVDNLHLSTYRKYLENKIFEELGIDDEKQKKIRGNKQKFQQFKDENQKIILKYHQKLIKVRKEQKDFEVGGVILLQPQNTPNCPISLAIEWFDSECYLQIKQSRLIIHKMYEGITKRQKFSSYEPKNPKHNQLLESKIEKWLNNQRKQITNIGLDIKRFS